MQVQEAECQMEMVRMEMKCRVKSRREHQPEVCQLEKLWVAMYYQIGEEHKEFCAEKTQDEDYYVLTLAAIARELDGKGMNRAKVHIAAGLPLTWVATQKEDFQKYLLQNECVDFTFRNKDYHVEFAGADIYPQGFAAAFYRLQDFKGINMLVDIGNGTMNIMYINNSRPLEKKCFTEKYGTHQCVLAVRESLLKELGTVVDDLVIEQVIRTGTADIGVLWYTKVVTFRSDKIE